MAVTTTERNRTVRMTLGVVGIVFILAGIYGFFDPTFFGIFNLTNAHNWVHVLTGLLYSIIAFAPVATNIVAWIARVGGIAYALLGVVGFFAPTILAPLMVLGTNENVFHLVIGLVVAILGFMLPTGEETRREERTTTTTTHRR